MCNPRQLIVRLTREVAAAWQEEISRTVRLTQTLSAQARARVGLMDSIGDDTRDAFERAIATDSRWHSVPGGYRIAVEEGEAYYYPDTGELEIVISMSECVEVAERAVRDLSASLRQTVESSLEGRYYSDVRGHRESVNEQLTRAVEADLDEREGVQRTQLEEALRRLVEERRAEAESDAERAALRQAEDVLAQLAEVRQSELEAETRRRLEATRDSVMLQIQRLIGEALMAMIRALAANGQARNLVQHVDDNGVVTMQFEVQRERV